MAWDDAEILKSLKKLHKQGADLSYNAMAREHQSLLSACAYHFDSYKAAVQQAGIDYAGVTRRPRWTKAVIIPLIKKAKREGDDLHWSAVSKRRDELGKAAFAALQPRLFGSWDRALTAAGLDADDVNIYRKWRKESITLELRQRSREHEALNSGAIQREDPGLHAAAVRHFGGYDAALLAAKLDPAKLRQRKSWSKRAVKDALKARHAAGEPMNDSIVRRQNPALYGACVRLYGAFHTARAAAGIKAKP
ncbi:MAG TPA: hypothetical protein VFC78_15410 [Tepidisphaeraceae bacterium]|nr:hypothetical protein [Tepidisphaeraceae bacterium]